MLSNHNELFQSVDSEGYSRADAQRGCLKPFLNTPEYRRNAAHVACSVARGTWHVTLPISTAHTTERSITLYARSDCWFILSLSLTYLVLSLVLGISGTWSPF